MPLGHALECLSGLWASRSFLLMWPWGVISSQIAWMAPGVSLSPTDTGELKQQHSQKS